MLWTRAADASVCDPQGARTRSRAKQAREAQVVVGLQHEAHRGEQVLHRQRRGEPQPVHARDRHPLGVEPRDQQLRQLAALGLVA